MIDIVLDQNECVEITFWVRTLSLEEIFEKLIVKQERLKRYLPKKLRPFFGYPGR